MASPKPTDLIAKISGDRAQASPVEIDTVLAWYYEAVAEAKAKIARQEKLVTQQTETVARLLRGEKIPGFYTPADGIQILNRLIKAKSEREAADELRAILEAEALPYQAQYSARRWSRYFLVRSDGGHVHRSMSCQTCNREGVVTRFAWMVEMSGRDEHELTDEISENACSVCFPWAETIRVEHEARVKAERKAAREAAAAAKTAAARSKGITAEDGGELRDHHGYQIRTEREAVDAVADLLDHDHWDRLVWEPIYAANPGLRGSGVLRDAETPEARAKRLGHLARIAGAIAAKQGRTVDEVVEELDKKSVARVKRTRSDTVKNAYRLATGLPQWAEYAAGAKAEGRALWNPYKK